MFFVDVVTRDGGFRYAGFNPAEEKAVGLLSKQVTGRLSREHSSRIWRESWSKTTGVA
jgi:hypothetical protein